MWLDIATLLRSKKSKGGFVVKAAAGLPFLLQPGMQVRFVPPQIDAPRSARVSDVRSATESSATVLFDFSEVVDEEALAALDGSHCLVPRDVANATADELGADMSLAALHAAFDGWTMQDAAGEVVGTVVDCVEHPTQLTLTVQLPTGEEKLVPVADDLLLSLDEEDRVLRVQLPAGILEL